MEVFAPPPDLTVSEWADQYRILSPEASAEPGPWSTERAEYLRGIMDAISDPLIREVVVKSSSQVGKTEIINNAAGYIIDQDPAPILVLQPTVEMGEIWSKDRLAPMIRDTKCLSEKVNTAKARNSNNTILHKTFPGGHLSIVGSNSAAGLASRPIRDLLADEIDRYAKSAGTEGDPLKLAKARQKTFWNAKTIKVSTPTIKHFSPIDDAWEEGDKRRFYVPCPHCGEKQYLVWANVKFYDRDPNTARYLCNHCGVLWTDAQRYGAVRKGEWVAEKEFDGTASFHLNELYSPWRKLADIVDDFLKAKDNPEKLKVWVNTCLGEAFEEKGEGLEPDSLMARRENYDHVPMNGLVLTAGIDVQDNRLECEVVAWGHDHESWSIDYRIFYGNPSLGVIWKELDDYLKSTFQHESGLELKITSACIDSGGHHTTEVYKFCKARQYRRIYAIKGNSHAGTPVVGRPSKKNKGNVLLFPVGTDTAKARLQLWLQISEPGPGYCHFSNTVNDEEYFKQLTVEKMVTRYHIGEAKRVWVKPDGARNESLDCRVYAMAAMEILNPNYEAIQKTLIKDSEKSDVDESPKKPIKSKRKQKGGYVKRW